MTNTKNTTNQMRFTPRDRAEMRARGIDASDPNNGRCQLCNSVIWYAELAYQSDAGMIHESCRARQALGRLSAGKGEK